MSLGQEPACDGGQKGQLFTKERESVIDKYKSCAEVEVSRGKVTSEQQRWDSALVLLFPKPFRSTLICVNPVQTVHPVSDNFASAGYGINDRDIILFIFVLRNIMTTFRKWSMLYFI